MRETCPREAHANGDDAAEHRHSSWLGGRFLFCPTVGPPGSKQCLHLLCCFTESGVQATTTRSPANLIRNLKTEFIHFRRLGWQNQRATQQLPFDLMANKPVPQSRETHSPLSRLSRVTLLKAAPQTPRKYPAPRQLWGH